MKFYRKASAILAIVAVASATGCSSNTDRLANNINKVQRQPYGTTASNWNNRLTTSISDGVITNHNNTNRRTVNYTNRNGAGATGNTYGVNRLRPSTTGYPTRTINANGARNYSYPTTTANQMNATTAGQAVRNTTSAINRSVRNATGAINKTASLPRTTANRVTATANKNVVNSTVKTTPAKRTTAANRVGNPVATIPSTASVVGVR